MKRVVVLIGVVLCVALSGAIAPWLTGVTAQEERTIPIRAVKFSDSQFVEDGKPCSFAVAPLRLMGADHQVVVRNETDTIIAMFDLAGGTWEEDTDDLGSFKCTIEHNLAVPEAEFYTVYLGDERIRGYSANDFPIADIFGGIWISFD